MNEGKKSLSDSKKIVGSSSPSQKLEKNKGLVILRGITTSQINRALKTKNPYPARVFLKVDNQDQDIPVFFRIRENWNQITPVTWTTTLSLSEFKEDNWIRPKIPTGSLIEVKGYFDNPKNGSQRPSFTAYSYQLLTSNHSRIEYLKNE